MRRNALSGSVPCILAIAGIILFGCGGGGGGTTPVTTATIQGSVSGTIIMAIDETGKIAAKDDTAGRTPVDGKYPFTLTVPVGHQYTIQFIVTDDVTGEERVVPLYQGKTNIFSVASTGTLDLGFVDTSAAHAASDNNILAQSGVTSGGTTPPPTIKLQGYRYLYTRNDTAGAVTAIFHVQVTDPVGTPVWGPSLVKDVKIYDNTWMELPLDGNHAFWNGTDLYFDTSGSIGLLPLTDLEGVLQAVPSSLAAGFYNVVATDNAGNLHNAKVYFRQPDPVDKPSSLAQVINTDNSITLSWILPTLPSSGKWSIYLVVASDDVNGDGIADSVLHVRRNTPMTTYTIPADFVANELVGKSGLKWNVQIRQYDDTIVFPDGTSQGVNTQFYRNYSAEKTLTLPTPPVGAFSQADLTGTWDLMEFTTVGAPPGGGWNRLVIRIDAAGHVFVDDNTTLQNAFPGVYINNGDSGLVLTINSAGVVSSTGSLTGSNLPTPIGFHGNMASSKQLLVATSSWGASGRTIHIARKRVPGLAYGDSDLANKSFALHLIESGAVNGWSRGTGTIDGSLQVRLTSMEEDPTPSPPDPVDPDQVVEQLQIDGNGLVSAGSNPTFKGFLTADKTTLFLVNTLVDGAATSYGLVAISLVNPAKTFTLADLAGTFQFHSIWTSPRGWAYGTLMVGSDGNGTISGTEPDGSWPAIPITLSISSDGEVRVTNMDPTFHGTLSPNGALLISNVTDSFGYGEYSLGIMVK